MGRLTADPELRHTQNDVAVTSFTLAVERDFKNASGEKESDFINIAAWRHTAEFVCNYFQKGLLVAVVGSVQTRKYTDKDGNNRKAVEIVASSVYFAERKKENEDTASDDSPATAEASGSSGGGFDPFAETTFNDDGDLPF